MAFNSIIRPVAWSSPLRVAALVLLLVFVVEFGIMLVLPAIVVLDRGSFAEGMADATALSIVLAPAMWFLLVRPQRQMFQERGELLGRVYQAQEDERRRLGRDLHDQVGQHLTALLIGLRAMQHSASVSDAGTQAATLHRLAGESLDQVRHIARGLRPSVLEDFGLATACERLCEDLRVSLALDIKLDMQVPHDMRFAAPIENAAYRILQESLTNVAKHAAAAQVTVRVGVEPAGGLLLSVHDNGCGFDTSIIRGPRSFGVRGMIERATVLGGTLKVSSSAQGGTQIEARFPRGPAV